MSVAMDHADLESWAIRAAQDLQEYADAAEEAGGGDPVTKALLAEFEEIRAGRETWARRAQRSGGEQEETLLDRL